MIMAPCSVRQNRGVKNLAAASAFPCIKGSYVIVKFFVEHTAFAFWTFHN